MSIKIFARSQAYRDNYDKTFGLKVRITEIHPRDSFYCIKDGYIGLVGRFEPYMEPSMEPGYCVGRFYPDRGFTDLTYFFFIAIKYEEIQ